MCASTCMKNKDSYDQIKNIFFSDLKISTLLAVNLIVNKTEIGTTLISVAVFSEPGDWKKRSGAVSN